MIRIRSMRSRKLSFVLPGTMLILACLSAAPAVAAGTPAGPGIAGQIHALAFDPTDLDAVYAGGDVCGIYRSDNYGSTWYSRSDGLASTDLTASQYIDDLIVIRSPLAAESRRGVYAATHGGIYFRGPGAWTSMTSQYKYSGGLLDDGGAPDLMAPIPFACFAFDDSSGILYAGAGHGRWVENGGIWRPYYPETENSANEYSLWQCDLTLSGDGQWYPVAGSQGHGIVRQITISQLADGSRHVVFATRRGIYAQMDGQGAWEDLWEIADKDLSWGGMAWGVGAGLDGRLYCLRTTMYTVVGQDTIPESNPGIYVCDLDDQQPEWSELGDWDATVWPTAHTLRYYLERPANDMLTLTVDTSGGNDQVFMGQRLDTSHGGYFRYGPYVAEDSTQTTGWTQVIYLTDENGGDATWDHIRFNGLDYLATPIRKQEGIDVGWLSNSGIQSTTPLVVHPADPGRVFAIGYHIPLARDPGTGDWIQRYCEGTAGSWNSRGLNVGGPTDFAFLPDGRMVVSFVDWTGFITDQGRTGYDWLEWWATGYKRGIDIELSGDSIYLIKGKPQKWIQGVGTVYFGYQLAADDRHVQQHVIAEYAPELNGMDGDDGYGWRYLSRGLDAAFADVPADSPYIHFDITDIEVYDEQTIFAACRKEIAGNVWNGRVFRGAKVDTGYVWTQWWERPACAPVKIKRIPGTSKLLVAAARADGGVFCLDAETPFVADEWLARLDPGLTEHQRDALTFVTDLQVDRAGSTVYVASRGEYFWHPGTAYCGAVFRVDLPPGGAPAAQDWVTIANAEGVNSFGFTAPTDGDLWPDAWIGGDLEAAKRLTHVRSLIIDPVNPHKVYIGLGSGGLRSFGTFHPTDGVWTNTGPDAAPQWQQIFGTLAGDEPVSAATCFGLPPDDPGTLYVGTSGRDLFQLTIPVHAAPVLEPHAAYVLAPATGAATGAVLAVSGTSAAGDTLAAVRADVSVLGDLRGWIPLERVADELWAVDLDTIMVDPGTYNLPVVARDADWNTFAGELTVTVAPGFVDKSADTGALKNVTGDPSVAIPVDYDRDGLQDIMLGFVGAAGRLMRSQDGYQGVPDCSDNTPSVFPSYSIPQGTLGLVTADYDNDGDEDLLVSHITSPRFFRCDTDSLGIRYTDITASVFEKLETGDPATDWDARPDHVFAAAWGDYNGDGWVDLAVIGRIDDAAPPGYAGGVANLILYRNDGGLLRFSDAAATTVGDHGYIPEDTPVFVIWHDFDGDGRQDLLLSDVEAPQAGIRLFMNEGFSAAAGDCEFTDKTVDWFAADRGPDKVVAARVFDFDNDEFLDIVVAREGATDNLLVFRNASTHFVEVDKTTWKTAPFAADLVDIVAWDFDHNGAEDLVAIPKAGGSRPRLLLNGLAGSGRFHEMLNPGFAAGDYRRGLAANWGSNQPAIFLAKYKVATSELGFFYTFGDAVPQNDNAYTRLRIGNAGTVSGSAIGALIEVKFTLPGASAATQVCRTIDGGSGHGGQGTRTIDFGLGAFGGDVVTVAVHWPDGTNDTMDVPVTSRASADSVYTIEKTTAALAYVPHKVNRQWVNASATYNLGLEDDNWWVFRWDMNHQGKCHVVFEYNDHPFGCPCMSPGDPAIVRPGDLYVDYEVIQTGEHVFQHTLIWRGRCCYQNCTFGFEVFGALGSPEIGSGGQSCATGSICTSGM